MFTADKPLRHVSEDEYGRERYVENLAYAIVTGDDSNGLVVGVEGEWGSGKRSCGCGLASARVKQPSL